jgi:hypothetical protein
VVTRIAGKVGAIQIHIPPEPMIAGAMGAALFALDRARKEGRHDEQVRAIATAPLHAGALN